MYIFGSCYCCHLLPKLFQTCYLSKVPNRDQFQLFECPSLYINTTNLTYHSQSLVQGSSKKLLPPTAALFICSSIYLYAPSTLLDHFRLFLNGELSADHRRLKIALSFLSGVSLGVWHGVFGCGFCPLIGRSKIIES